MITSLALNRWYLGIIGPLDSGEPSSLYSVLKTTQQIKLKKVNYIVTFNANSLRRIGNLKEITDLMTQ